VLHSWNVRQTTPNAPAVFGQSEDYPALLAEVQSKEEIQELQEDHHLSAVMCPQDDRQTRTKGA